ncbi:restriction endonuclease subunit S [[Lactobacillus] timonensis]|uniref:restriction endonuclease subunit S n=1 Tax=[Lactobacillus] timonensis TaxID=1970790 RepID=UPI001F454460|nr:restriction endonuclease subunit S [[Lactobacillus] timonensis]
MQVNKDSGIKWVGEIPDNWDSVPIYYVSQEVRKKNNNIFQKAALKFTYGTIVRKKNFSIDEDPSLRKTIENYKVVKPKDIVINGLNLNFDFVTQRVGFVTSPGAITSAYIVIRAKNNINEKYLLYLLKSYDSVKAFNNMGGGVRRILNFNILSKIKIPFPPMKEQKRIADFLDKKCGQIDKLLVRINDEIERLKVYQNSLIIRTVTKGLDLNISMKDSGIEWVGSIPESWGVVPLYKLFNERKSKNIAGREQNLLSLSYGKIKRRDINAKGGLLPANFNTYNIVEDGDIIIRPTDLQNDQHSLRTGIVKEHGIITSAYIDLAPLPNTNSAYYHYLLHSYDIEKVFYNMGNGVRQGLNYNEFSKLKVLVPSDREMCNIVDYLNRKNRILDSLVEKKQQQLNLLKEYKNSLIYEYVTGKKQVPKM